ncbi:entericidin A/B family lipoprotein [Luteimonas sp. 8-5]|uniref:entericidin A/B family lipoprotein n=1 Tax=Luteimonas sp. 8-5 TaxID=3039387 RepID=UPI002437430A|nr:entericidin A/B family lipoprotein [Luteimonas sp. 8-5]MDG6348534.1 entericidin A/B family lipoprotein [Luteimonas sp. 8-5]
MQINRKHFASAILISMLSMGLLSACHTVEGVGKDIESAGDSIKDTAQDCHDDQEGNCP